MLAGKYRFNGTCASLLRRLAEIRVEDKKAEKEAAKYGWLAALSLIAIVILIIAGMLVRSSWLFYGGPACIVPAVVFLVIRGRHKKHDLEDRKYELIARILTILRVDVSHDEKVDVRVDFRGYQAGGRLLGENRSGGVRQYRYQHAWLAIRVRLADGSRVGIQLADKVSRKEKPKRKYTKVTEQRTGVLGLTVRLGRKRYGEPGSIRPASPPAPLKVRRFQQTGSVLRAILSAGPVRHVQGRSGSSVTGATNEIDGDLVLRTLVWIFASVAARRKSA